MALLRVNGNAMEYVYEALAQPYPFAEAMRRLPWEQGSLWSFVPASEDERWPSWEAYLHFILHYLDAGGRRAFVISHAFPSRSAYARLLEGPRLGRAWADWCVCGDALCFYATETAHADIDQIIHVLEDVQAPATFGVLAHDVALPWHADLAQEALDALVSRAEYAVFEIDAYDNSAALVWSRTGTL
jgi:hypothetical protein